VDTYTIIPIPDKGKVGCKVIDRTGERWGKLVVLSCVGLTEDYDNKGKKKRRRSVWRCQCDCGRIVNKLGGVHIGKNRERQETSKASCGFCRIPKYGTIHIQVRKKFGDAHEYWCELDCGRHAQEWACINVTHKELANNGSGNLLGYSLDLDDYIPVCRLCHRILDDRGNRMVKGRKMKHYRECITGLIQLGYEINPNDTENIINRLMEYAE
jgi:hypothetical protein